MHLIFCCSDASDLISCAEIWKLWTLLFEVNFGQCLLQVLRLWWPAYSSFGTCVWYTVKPIPIEVVIFEVAAISFRSCMYCGLRGKKKRFCLRKTYCGCLYFTATSTGLGLGLTVCLVLWTYLFVPSRTSLMLHFCCSFLKVAFFLLLISWGVCIPVGCINICLHSSLVDLLALLFIIGVHYTFLGGGWGRGYLVGSL